MFPVRLNEIATNDYTHHFLLKIKRLISKLAGRCDSVFNNAASKAFALCLFALTVLTYVK